VIAGVADLCVAGFGVKPPTEGERAQYVLVGARGQRSSNMRGRPTGPRGHGVGDYDVKIGGLHSDYSHADSPLGA
jgi:hypothetical protein